MDFQRGHIGAQMVFLVSLREVKRLGKTRELQYLKGGKGSCVQENSVKAVEFGA